VKLIYVTANLPHGSDEAFIVPELRELLRRGHEVLVVPRSPRGLIIHGNGFLQHACREALYSPHVVRSAARAILTRPRQTMAAARPLLRSRSAAVAAKNAAIVPKALWLAGVAARWRADHIHCHWAGTTATMAMLASRISGIPWSFTAHRWDIVENNLLAEKVRSASLARFISADGLTLARASGVSPKHNTRVLHMGVTIPEKISRWHGPRPIVVCPGRLVEVKGHRFLLEAWRILQGLGQDGELWVIGQGELRAQLEALAQNLGLGGSVRFLGGMPHRELLKIYEEAPVSAVVLSSLDLGNGLHEGIPVALIEAMSYGIPVVATSTGGTPELVVPGTGLLVPPGNPADLAEAIRGLLRDSQLNRQIGDAGRQRVIDGFDIVRVATELVNEFEAAVPRGTTLGALQYA
jgi:glycosyltransferase involved in cell wall biosynthesis